MIVMTLEVALVELSRGTAGGISALEKEFVYDYWMWANRRFAIRRLPFDIETYRCDLETVGVAIPGWLAD